MTARRGNLLGLLACAGLLAYAYYAQYVMHLEPCPLCIFQRIGVFALGVLFLIAALHDPAPFGRRWYALLLALAALATIGVAARHLYIMSLPPGSVPACGASLDFMLKVFSLSEVLVKVLTGSGECAKVTWEFLGLAMPAWVLISAALLGAYGVWVNLRRQPHPAFLMSSTLQLTQELIARQSVSPTDGGCQTLMIERLTASGFTVESLRFGAVDNFWAKRGSGGPVFCFAGHTDVVPSGPLDEWRTDPFQPVIKDGLLYGRGAADMKSGLAAMLTASEEFIGQYPKHRGTIAFLITSDEEGLRWTAPAGSWRCCANARRVSTGAWWANPRARTPWAIPSRLADAAV